MRSGQRRFRLDRARRAVAEYLRQRRCGLRSESLQLEARASLWLKGKEEHHAAIGTTETLASSRKNLVAKDACYRTLRLTGYNCAPGTKSVESDEIRRKSPATLYIGSFLPPAASLQALPPVFHSVSNETSTSTGLVSIQVCSARTFGRSESVASPAADPARTPKDRLCCKERWPWDTALRDCTDCVTTPFL